MTKVILTHFFLLSFIMEIIRNMDGKIQTRISIKLYQNTTRKEVFARSRFPFFLFSIIYTKKEELVDNN